MCWIGDCERGFGVMLLKKNDLIAHVFRGFGFSYGFQPLYALAYT